MDKDDFKKLAGVWLLYKLFWGNRSPAPPVPQGYRRWLALLIVLGLPVIWGFYAGVDPVKIVGDNFGDVWATLLFSIYGFAVVFCVIWALNHLGMFRLLILLAACALWAFMLAG